MSETRCHRHDLILASCADCAPRPGVVTAPASLPSERGPWSIAAYDGACHGCGEDIEPGDEIRADGHGGWEGRCCDDTEPAAATGTSEAQAGTLAAFWGQG